MSPDFAFTIIFNKYAFVECPGTAQASCVMQWSWSYGMCQYCSRTLHDLQFSSSHVYWKWPVCDTDALDVDDIIFTGTNIGFLWIRVSLDRKICNRPWPLLFIIPTDMYGSSLNSSLMAHATACTSTVRSIKKNEDYLVVVTKRLDVLLNFHFTFWIPSFLTDINISY
jgi:hypothetical protein